ncbi:unnamed protein product [Rotaria magnacalcarata]|uniref:FLYWCH-type domain-containing protein n=2 Tax=Rotaria magnacalcarata TaxID=392030 RepID=A0A815CGW8_9BILA|nr:unnamed protein product [Rotaria magnacalcarata]CAF4046141.1 unnamed protein product [Rotaria magnacalcarata]
MNTHTIKNFTSEKGKAMLSYEGYIYTLERKNDVKLIFRCQNRDYKGRCHTNPTMDVIVSAPTEHCHASKPDLVPVLELKNKIKSRAAETNVYDRAVANLPRSKNAIEGWHNAFAKRVAIVHPTITKLTEKIRREQSKFEVDIAQIRQGQEPKPKKLKYRKLDERIKRLVDDYGNVDLGDYLKGLAVNMSL